MCIVALLNRGDLPAMPLARHLRRFRYHPPQQQHRRRQLWLESLEDRSVPSILFNNATTTATSDGGGLVIDHVHVELIFWGSGWNTGQGPTLHSQTEAAVDSITSGPYLSYLSQYRPSIGSGTRVGSVTIDSSSPGSVFHDQDVRDMVATNIGNQTLPDPASDPQLLYVVIPQLGSNSNFGATHSYLSFGSLLVHYLWTTNVRGFDGITYFFSHELAESVSDAEGTAIQVNPRNDFVWNEISDGNEAQSYSYRLNGYLLQSWFSQADHAFVVPTGQAQNFYISNRTSRVLTVNGGQLANPNDTITIDQENGAYKVTLNGEAALFDGLNFLTNPVTVSSITVNTGNGDDTVNVERTISGRPVTVNLGSGTNTVNISPVAQNLSNVAEAVTINGGSGFDSLFVWDQNSNLGRAFTIGDGISASGAARLIYNSLSNVVLVGGNGGNTFNLQRRSAPLTLKGGAGPNRFVFSDGAGISGNLEGGSAGSFDYSAYTTGVSVNLQSGTATGVGGTFDGIQSFTGGGGSNTLVGADVSSIWNITGTNTGSINGGAVTFTGFQNLAGGGVADTFILSDGAGISGNLNGGAAGSLDYSFYSSSVIVDLRTATATGVGGGIANIQNVTGGNGGGAGVFNILVGNGGNILTGGNGRRNLLIAGLSASTLLGGEDDDILIGGTTAYDMDLASLIAIMNYWSGTADDYATRVGNLLAGNGVPLLDATTVTSNGGGNTLNGLPGLNLYYGTIADITDFDPSSGAVFVQI
jgi:hypothetical protein